MELFLKLLNKKDLSKIPPISKQLETQIITKETYDHYSEELKAIYQHIFNDRKNNIEMSSIMPFLGRKTKVPICNKLLSLHQTIYRCYECCIHQAAALCSQCFQNGQHSGHRFKKIESEGGNCDCGNPLALKKQGFCSNHSGQIQIPQISQLQQNKFHEIIGTMLQWLFLLKNNNIKFYQLYGYILLDYLCKLNKESIYYNVMTFHVLTKKLNNNTCFIDEIFKFKEESLVQKFKQLFFLMFNLDQFKTILADKFITAYNTVLDFENTEFYSLYIQLLANDIVIFDLCQKYKNTLYIQKPQYDYGKYLNDINFIYSLQQKSAFAFYELYLSKNSCIPFEPLNEIEKRLQQEGQMHQVDLVTNYLNNENYYYIISLMVLNKIKNNEKLVRMFAKGLFETIMSNKYSFIKNRAILPLHRMFASAIFTLFKGNLHQLSIPAISEKLELQQSQVLNFYHISIPKILNCLLDFAQTYARRNYFDNYIVLYVRSGVACGNYDYLFLKQAAFIYSSRGQNFTTIITQLFEQNYKNFSTNQISQTYDEFINKWIYFYEIFIEIAVSYLSEINANQKINLQNQILLTKRQQIFKEILKKLGSVTKSDLGILEKFFIEKANEQFLFQNAQLNKITKKYALKADDNEKVGNFHYEIYISKRKTGQLLLKQEELGINQKESQLVDQEQVIALNTLLPMKLIENLINFVVAHTNQLEDLKIRENIAHNFVNVLAKLSMFNKDAYVYLSIEKELRKALNLQQKKQTSGNIEEANKLRQQMLKKKMFEKKVRMLQKQNKVLNKLQGEIKIRKCSENQQEIRCILCRDEEKVNQNLCYFANVKNIKLIGEDIQKSMEDEENNKNIYGFIYNTCFHTAHYSCFKNLYKESFFFYCPLCKTPCNIMLPVNFQYLNSTYKENLNKIEFNIQQLHKKFSPNKNEEEKEGLFLSMISSLVEQIGFVGLLNSAQFERKVWKICRQLIKILYVIWNSCDGYTKQQIYQNIGKQLQKNEIKHAQNQKDIIIKAIRHNIIWNIFNAIQGREFNKAQTPKLYKQKINPKDLNKIMHNLQIVLTNNSTQSQSQEQTKQNEGNTIKSLQQLIVFYKFPSNVKQLISKRDQAVAATSSTRCKVGHNICICIQCQKVVCLDCKTLSKHSKIHRMQSLYFSLLTGGIIFSGIRQIRSRSLYENKFGTFWTAEKQPQDFMLNKEEYKKVLALLLSHSVSQYIQKKIIQHNPNSNLVEDYDV